MPTLKELAYTNAPVSYRVFIDATEITDRVRSVNNIEENLDIDIVAEFNVNNCTLIVNNDGDFSAKPNNLYHRLGYSSTGYNAPVEIHCGFEDDTGTIVDSVAFKGAIISSTEDVKGTTVRIEVGDISADLQNVDITDFGIAKYGSLAEDTERSRSGILGVYPFGTLLSPVSDESVNGTSGGQALVYKQELDREGELNPLNFSYDDDSLETEGGTLTNPPVVALKAPYRHKRIGFLIDEILDAYSFTNREVVIPDIAVTRRHFSTNGRAGYDLEGSDPMNTALVQWSGYVTQYIYDGTNDRYYFLYSHRQHETIPRFMQLDVATDTWSVLYTHSGHSEYWKVATSDNNTFFILGTTGQTNDSYNDRFYDSSETNSTVTIWKLDVMADTFEVFLDSSDTLRPQLASILRLGFDDELEIGAAPRIPDTNKGFQVVGTHLYYRYATATASGVAKIPTAGGTATSLYAVVSDERTNAVGGDFYIVESNSTGYGFANWVASNSSEYKIFSFSI